MEEFKTIISHKRPSNTHEWDKMCKICGNLFQSTNSDLVFNFYHNEPYYFEVINEDKLIAGIKIYISESKKLPKLIRSISRRALIFGEVVKFPIHSDVYKKVREILQKEICLFLKKTKTTTFSINGFYGYTKPLRINRKANINEFGILIINLNQDADALWSGLHTKQRNMVRRAQKEGLIFKETKNINLFLDLLYETYSKNSGNMPNPEYIKHLYHSLADKDFAKIFLVTTLEGEALSGSIVQIYGNVADYSFGGNKKNNLGAGQFLQWKTFEYLKKHKVEKYSLGQVAKGNDIKNLKFSRNITRFKMRFGGEKINSEKLIYNLHPVKKRIWEILIKIFI